MQSQGTIKHRRARVPLSCDPCRVRKLKCNRETPCQNCMARGEHAACLFHGPKNGAVPVARRDATGDAMRQRIDHLEDLVKNLIAERHLVTPPSHDTIYTPQSSTAGAGLTRTATTPEAQDAVGVGKTVMDGVHSVYLGGDDWYVVLQEINELKRTWSQERDDDNDYDFRPTLSHTVDGSSLLFNQVKPIERIEILSTIPPKSEVDRLVSQFFDRQAFPIAVPPILHVPTFMREYNEHWKDPSKTSPIWLGLLFSILGITMLAYHQYGEPPEFEGISESLFQLYRMRTSQCLLSGDIAKCLPYTVETLRFNATAELNRKDDNRRGLWIMTGVVVRTAVNMGYHRDPSHSPDISALQAEYRRRIWLSVISMDDMASFLGGFPRTMSAIYSNTMEPRNLHDWELFEDTTILPPSHPLTEPTSTTYLIVKGRLFHALGRIADFNSTPNAGSYETMLEIDHVVYEAYQNFPSHMKVADIGDTSNPVGGLANFSNLSLLGMYHKGMCTLHRRFLGIGRNDDRFRFSHHRCISSALALLTYQQGLESSFYKLSETRQMLALGAMVLFLELELRRKAPETDASPDDVYLLQALDKSCNLWAGVTDTCEEARKFHLFLASMLSRFRDGTNSSPENLPTIVSETPFQFPGLSPQYHQSNLGFVVDKYPVDVDFDWATWDTFIEDNSYETGPIY